MKKKVLLGLAAAGMLFMTGCIADTYALTEEEQDIIAEYAATVLLRNDENYAEALLSPTPTPTPIPTMTPTPTPTPTPAPTPQGGSTSAAGRGEEAEIQANADLNQVFGLAELQVEYSDYQVTDSYSLKDNQSFIIRADAGKQLVIINVSLENTAGILQAFDFGGQAITYHLDCNEENFARPEITVLENDLLYMTVELAPGEKKEAVLIFQTGQAADLSDANLIVSRGDYTAIVSLD